MTKFLLSLVVFSTFYFPLRLLKDNWVRLSLPHWCIYVAGSLSWATLFSLAGPPVAIGFVCANVIASLSIGAAFEAAAVFFLVAIVANLVVVHREVLDWDHMQPFIRSSLMFSDYFGKQEDLFVQLEKKQIRDIHKETSGHELIEHAPKKKELAHLDPDSARRELEESRSKTFQSSHLDDDIASLKNGESVDVTDTFKINALKHLRNRLYQHCVEMRIGPLEKCLSFKVHFDRITAETTLSTDLLFHVKQDLYDMLQAVISEPWLQPFDEFIETISATCCCVASDGFGLPQHFRFMKVEIPVHELRIREEKIFSVGDLHTIARITMFERPGSNSGER